MLQQCNDAACAALPMTSFITFILIITNIINCAFSMNELCPAQCKCEDEFLRAACVFASLEVVPIQLNPEIQHLDLSNNRIGSLTLAFGFYDNLLSLDISSNVLHTLGSENFLLQKSLLKLNVSNNGIRAISKSALKGLESLTVLDLSNNNLSDIDSQAFRYANELQDIDLSGNSLLDLPNGLLKNLHQIRKLKLSRNSLLQVPKSNLQLTPSLQSLDLSENLILRVNQDSLPSLRSLITLDLSNNVISTVSDSAFERLPALLYLNLEGNNLTHVPTQSLARLSVLSHLILSRNPMQTLNSLAFRNLFELKILDLRQCELESIDQHTFADNINLEHILLDGNYKLQYLPPRVLYNARYLKSVSLRHCKLSTLQPTHFPIDDLKVLQVGGNPFACNCSLHWLWNVIHIEEQRNTTKLRVDSDEIVCNDSEFNGELLMSLSENSLRCRLSSLYLTLLVAGCLVATVTILVLIAWITRVKRRKRLPFAPPNRPELLVYVGSSQNEPSKHSMVGQHSRDKQLIRPSHVGLYDLPHQQNNENVIGGNNFHYFTSSNSDDLYERPQNDYQSAQTPSFGNIDGFNVFPDSECLKQNCQAEYAVTDVTGMIRNDRTTRPCFMDSKYDYRGDLASNDTSHVAFV